MKHILTIEQLQQGKYYWWINKTNSTIIQYVGNEVFSNGVLFATVISTGQLIGPIQEPELIKPKQSFNFGEIVGYNNSYWIIARFVPNTDLVVLIKLDEEHVNNFIHAEKAVVPQSNLTKVDQPEDAKKIWKKIIKDFANTYGLPFELLEAEENETNIS